MTTNLLSLVLAQSKSQGSPLGLLILLVPMGAILWLTIVPQRKQRQKQAALMSQLAVGEEVVTNGGIIGTITFLEDDVVHLEVDSDVVIRVAKGAISRTTSEPAPAAKGARVARGSGDTPADGAPADGAPADGAPADDE